MGQQIDPTQVVGAGLPAPAFMSASFAPNSTDGDTSIDDYITNYTGSTRTYTINARGSSIYIAKTTGASPDNIAADVAVNATGPVTYTGVTLEAGAWLRLRTTSRTGMVRALVTCTA